MTESLSLRLAALAAARVNVQLTAAQRSAFAGFAGQHIGIQLAAAPPAVFRIGADGRLTAVSPLIEADVLLRWNNTRGGWDISGSAPLLDALSQVKRGLDLPAVAAGLFGPFLSPRLFYAWQWANENGGRWLAHNTVGTDEMAAYRSAVTALQNRVAEAQRRLRRL